MTESTGRPTAARIDLHALGTNLRSVRSFIGDDVQYMGVVKANAYGHGAVECGRVLASLGIDWLSVALVEEAIELRDAGINTPILCLGSFFDGQEDLVLSHDITAVVFDVSRARRLNDAARRVNVTARIHVKIDSGMGRVGIRWDAVDKFIASLREFGNLEIEGLLSHFAVADDLAQRDFTETQITRFGNAIESFRKAGHRPRLIHMANSPGAVARYPTDSNLVRLGGVLYGLGGDVLPAGIDKPALEPVMSLTTAIAFLKEVPTGETLGYGRTYTTTRDSLIATVPIGYDDGYPRVLSNVGSMIVRGHRVPVLGRVSMDWTILDVTDVPNVAAGDEVIVIGSQGSSQIRAEDLARDAGTISYEITCGVSSRVPRIFSGGDPRTE